MEYRFSSPQKSVFLTVSYKLQIVSETGPTLKDGQGRLSAYVVDTSTGEVIQTSPSSFIWDREEDQSSFTPISGKTLELTKDDLVDGSANFICSFSSPDIFWTAKESISISDVEGLSYSVYILSSNGNIFRPTSINTTLSCQVLQNDDDITAELDAWRFNWKRNTGNTALDEQWNTSSKAIGKKSIDITTADCIGRTVFTCEVEISETTTLIAG